VEKEEAIWREMMVVKRSPGQTEESIAGTKVSLLVWFSASVSPPIVADPLSDPLSLAFPTLSCLVMALNIWVAAGDGDLNRVKVCCLFNFTHVLPLFSI